MADRENSEWVVASVVGALTDPASAPDPPLGSLTSCKLKRSGSTDRRSGAGPISWKVVYLERAAGNRTAGSTLLRGSLTGRCDAVRVNRRNALSAVGCIIRRAAS